MDNAVALVQAYLRVNGYFTVSEFPVVERLRGGRIRTMTDLDILAFRFPGAGRVMAHAGGNEENTGRFEPDRVLAADPASTDMLIGEVKEGTAELNRAGRDPRVLEVVLARFGCCPAHEARRIAERLVRAGSVRPHGGHLIRLIAFGAAAEAGTGKGYLVVPLAHVVSFLQTHLRQHWDVLRHVQPKDEVFGFLTLLEKVRSAGRAP
ncbi:MAG: hypothetical protein L0271_07830 [Gemmatimonadetes bacterium]|nr:hypothetical protein [Gemmatimonadota bacterium]